MRSLPSPPLGRRLSNESSGNGLEFGCAVGFHFNIGIIRFEADFRWYRATEAKSSKGTATISLGRLEDLVITSGHNHRAGRNSRRSFRLGAGSGTTEAYFQFISPAPAAVAHPNRQ